MSDHESPLGLLEVFDTTRAQSLRIAELETEVARLDNLSRSLETTVQDLRLRLDNVHRTLADTSEIRRLTEELRGSLERRMDGMAHVLGIHEKTTDARLDALER